MENTLQSTSQLIGAQSFITTKYKEQASNYMNGFVSNSVVIKTEGENIARAKQMIYRNKNSRRMSKQQCIDPTDSTELNTSGLRSDTIERNKYFIAKKINAIRNDTLFKYNQIWKNQNNQSQMIAIRSSRSRQNLAKSILKKFSIQTSSNNQFLTDKFASKLQPVGKTAILNPYSASLNTSRQNSEDKIKRFFNAHQKTQNQRVIRLLHKQQEVEQKFSCVERQLKRKMHINANNRFSKRDAYFFANPHFISSPQQRQIYLAVKPLNKHIKSRRQNTVS